MYIFFIRRLIVVLSFVAIIIPTITIAQDLQITGMVLNNKEPLPFSTVEILSKERGVIADENGMFSIAINRNDTLLVRSLGYKDKIIYSYAEKALKVFLEPDSFFLPEIVVVPRTLITKEFGYAEKKAKVGFWSKPGTILGFHIKNEFIGKSSILNKVEFFINDEGIVATPIRIRFFEVNESGYPVGDLNNIQIIVTPKKGNKWYVVTLDDKKIELPENGICIGFEYLEDKSKYYFDIKMKDSKGNKTNRQSYGNLIGGYWSTRENNTWHKYLGSKWFQRNDKIEGKILNLAIKYVLEVEKQ